VKGAAASAPAPEAGPAAKRLAELVRRAWADVLERPCTEAHTWEEAGADSLASLHLLLALEKALGRKLSFDLIQPDMRLAELVQALGSASPVASAGAAAAPTVFLLPGLFGDEPRLAAFRRAFGARLRFEVVEHHDVTAPRALLCDLVAAGVRAACEIDDRQPAGPIFLAGYSFGGCVAYEAAAQLEAAGRSVAFLGILDTALDRSTQPSPHRLRRRLLTGAGRVDAWRGLLLAVVARLLPARSIAARRRLLAHFRAQALDCWKPTPRRKPALLVASAECAAAIVAPWSRLCPGLRVLRVPGSHVSIFEPAGLDRLVPAFEAAVQAAARDASAAVGAAGARREGASTLA
jgi:thioesterase domain-containing protein/acyl carrier protein